MSTLMAWLDLPMILRLMLHSASWVRMPARIGWMPMKVWKMPVTKPASSPAPVAARMATQTLQPASMHMMQTAPPVHSVPSTVRSAMSSTR